MSNKKIIVNNNSMRVLFKINYYFFIIIIIIVIYVFSFNKNVYSYSYNLKPESIRNDEIFIDSLLRVYENDLVIENNNLIGIIKNKYSTYMLVKLVSSNDFNIQVKVNDCYGIYKNNKIYNLNNMCNIKINDYVYVSDLITDKRIIIGKISKTIIDKNNINNIYEISLIGKFDNLNNLQIIRRINKS